MSTERCRLSERWETMEPDYLQKLRVAFPEKADAQLELLCSGSRQLQKSTGQTAHVHRRRAMEKMFPSRIWHEWREERIQSIQYCLENRIQELMWIGSSNSNKSADLADIALTLWWTNPVNTTIYVASPYEKATEEGVWAYIAEQFDEAKENVPSLPGKRRLSDNSIMLYDRNPRSFIKQTTVDQVGKLVGKKAKTFTDGLLVLILDELPAFTASASRNLLAVMANLVSVPNLLVIGAGNFAGVGDALGSFCSPDERDIPNGYDGFDPDQHFRWRTKRGGLALRFDGLKSPNVKAGRDIYPFVTTIEYINKLAGAPGGLNSADAMRYIRSAPVTNLDAFTITNGERIRAGGCYDEFEWTGDPITSGAYFDPGFGGDPCILQKFKIGTALIAGAKRRIMALWGAPFEIPLRVNAQHADGSPYTVEDQIADQAKEHCKAHGIPDDHVGYDGSLRASIVQAVGRRWSVRVRAIDSSGSPTDRKINAGEDKTWKKAVDRLLSEFWFAVASLIDSGQLRNLGLSPKAITQLCTRRWNWTGSKEGRKRVQTKAEYKDMLVAQGKPIESPNEADAVCGCVEMARQLGLQLEAVVMNGGSMELLLSMIREQQFRRQVNPHVRQTLPAGRLRGMNTETKPRNVKLSRYR